MAQIEEFWQRKFYDIGQFEIEPSKELNLGQIFSTLQPPCKKSIIEDIYWCGFLKSTKDIKDFVPISIQRKYPILRKEGEYGLEVILRNDSKEEALVLVSVLELCYIGNIEVTER